MVAGLMSRIYPDLPSGDRSEIGQIMRGVSNNVPGLLEEMLPKGAQMERFNEHRSMLPPDANPMNAGGPLLDRQMKVFAARTAFAMHFLQAGRVVPLDGGAVVRWYTNFQALTGRIPETIRSLLDTPQTLRQGKWNVGEQFVFNALAEPDGRRSVHYASFRMSFATAGMVVESLELLRPEGEAEPEVFRPGFLLKR